MKKNVGILIVLIVLYVSDLCILIGTLVSLGLLHLSTRMRQQLAIIEKLGDSFFLFFERILNYPQPGPTGLLELFILMTASLLLGLSIIVVVWKLAREADPRGE